MQKTMRIIKIKKSCEMFNKMTGLIQQLQRHFATRDFSCQRPLEAAKLEKTIDYECFISERGRRRIPTALREITKTSSEMPPESIKFAVGVPNLKTFPFQEVSIKLKDGSSFNIEGGDLEAALQYMPTSGHAPLMCQLQELQDRTHGAQDWSNRSVLVTSGCSEPMACVFDLVLNEGDPVIIPIPLYSGTYDTLRSYNPQYIGLEQDKDGIQPSELRQMLEDNSDRRKPIPKLMYINPTACNPTGRNIPLERRQEIYQIACDYNILIVEDDPYYYLNFSEEIPSFLSMDVEGRVVRLDSFSKTLSSGLRVGYVTGPTSLVRGIELHLQVSTIHPSALSQVVVSKLLETWGHEKYLAHIANVTRFYKERRDQMLTACDKYLTGLAQWEVPSGGMFLWLQVPGLEDTWSLAVKHCLEQCLLIVPGHPFTGDLVPSTNNFIRLSFSLASPTQMDEGIKLLARIIQEQLNKR